MKLKHLTLDFNPPMNFTKRLTSWYSKNKRELPWRENRDPYNVWLSEIILQQTRIEQGTPYYERFVTNYPKVQDLASAHEDEVLKLWQGLGYYSRARNLLKAANQIVEEFEGQFPDNYNDLLSLKGVGPYTAAAIASISFQEPVALVDGNVFRFLGRHFGVTDPIDTSAGKKVFHELAQELMDYNNPGDFNQALMEFGATVCTPHQPNCEACPFRTACEAYNQGAISKYPARSTKVRVQQLHLAYFVICVNDNIFMTQRPANGIWGGLFEFPGISSSQTISEEDLEKAAKNLRLPPLKCAEVSSPYKHVLTHRKITARFWLFNLENFSPPEDWTQVSTTSELQRLAVPRLIDRYLESRIFPESKKIVT